MRLVVLCLLVTTVAASSHGSGSRDHHGKGGMMGGKGYGKGGMMGGKGDGKGEKSMDQGPQCVCNITTPADTKPVKMPLKGATCGEAGAKCQSMCKTLMEKLKNGTMMKPIRMGPKGKDRWGRPKMEDPYRKICCMNAPSQSVSVSVEYLVKSDDCAKDNTSIPGNVVFNCENITCGDMKGKDGMDGKGKEKGKDMERIGDGKGKGQMENNGPSCWCNVKSSSGVHGKPQPIPGATCDNIETKCEEKCQGLLDKLKDSAEKGPMMHGKGGKRKYGRKGKHPWMKGRHGKDGKGKEMYGKDGYDKIKKMMDMKKHFKKMCCMNNPTPSFTATVKYMIKSSTCQKDFTDVPGSVMFNCENVTCGDMKGKDGMDKDKGKDMERMKGKDPNGPMDPLCVCNVTTPAGPYGKPQPIPGATCDNIEAKCVEKCKGLVEKLKEMAEKAPKLMGKDGMKGKYGPMDRLGRSYKGKDMHGKDGKGKGGKDYMMMMKDKHDYIKICCSNNGTTSFSLSVQYGVRSMNCQRNFQSVTGNVMFNCENVTCKGMKGKDGMDGKGKDMDYAKGKDPMGNMDPLCMCNVTSPAGVHGKPQPIPGATCDNIESKCEEKCRGVVEKLKRLAEKGPKIMKKYGMKGKNGPMDRYGRSHKGKEMYGKDGKGKDGYDKMKMDMKHNYIKMCCMNNESTSFSASVQYGVKSVNCQRDFQSVTGNIMFNCENVTCRGMKGKDGKDGKGKDMDRMGYDKGKDSMKNMDPMCVCNVTTPSGVHGKPHPIPGATCDNIEAKCEEKCRGLVDKLKKMAEMGPKLMRKYGMKGKHGPMDRYGRSYKGKDGKGKEHDEKMKKMMEMKYHYTKICCMNNSTTTVQATVRHRVNSTEVGCSTSPQIVAGSANFDCSKVKCDYPKGKGDMDDKGKGKGDMYGKGKGKGDMDGKEKGKGDMDRTDGKGPAERRSRGPMCICDMVTPAGVKPYPHMIYGATCDNIRGKCEEVCGKLLGKLQDMSKLKIDKMMRGMDKYEEQKKRMEMKIHAMKGKYLNMKLCCMNQATTSVAATVTSWVDGDGCSEDATVLPGSTSINCTKVNCTRLDNMKEKLDRMMKGKGPKGPKGGYGRHGKGKKEDMDPLCVCNMTTSKGTKAMPHPIRELTCDDDVRAKCSEACNGLLEKFRRMTPIELISSHGGGGDHYGKEQDKGKGKGKGIDKEMSDKEYQKKICCYHKPATSVLAAISFWVKSKTCGINTAMNLGSANIDCTGMTCDAPGKGNQQGRSGGQERPEGGNGRNVAETVSCKCRLRSAVADPLPEIPLSCPDCQCPDNERKCMKRCKNTFEASLPKYYCCGRERTDVVMVEATTRTRTPSCPDRPLRETWSLSCAGVVC